MTPNTDNVNTNILDRWRPLVLENMDGALEDLDLFLDAWPEDVPVERAALQAALDSGELVGKDAKLAASALADLALCDYLLGAPVIATTEGVMELDISAGRISLDRWRNHLDAGLREEIDAHLAQVGAVRAHTTDRERLERAAELGDDVAAAQNRIETRGNRARLLDVDWRAHTTIFGRGLRLEFDAVTTELIQLWRREVLDDLINREIVDAVDEVAPAGHPAEELASRGDHTGMISKLRRYLRTRVSPEVRDELLEDALQRLREMASQLQGVRIAAGGRVVELPIGLTGDEPGIVLAAQALTDVREGEHNVSPRRVAAYYLARAALEHTNDEDAEWNAESLGNVINAQSRAVRETVVRAMALELGVLRGF